VTVFGVDFGTTNSLAAYVRNAAISTLVDRHTARPHPSVIWYRGTEVVVGAEARKNLDMTDAGVPPGFVRSPKMKLRRQGSIFVDGRPIDPTDAVAEVLKHLRADAELSRTGGVAENLDRAVMTIPVDFGGRERRALRQAARKAGIGVVQFVHEPAAALYAYLRSRTKIAEELARLEGHSVLVFDWGGGTLDLTLCRIQGGSIMQVANFGDNEIGGDRFDDKLRNLVRRRHAEAHGLDDVTALEQAGMAAKLLNQCETAKINMSDPGQDDEEIFIKNYLRTEGDARHLQCRVTKSDLAKESVAIVSQGLRRIDEILDRAGLSTQDIELCLATGGMVNMPAIRDGLTERFLGRVPRLEHGDRIIAEGAAWIAYDRLRLTLSKPIEILAADTTGRGIYYPMVNAGWPLPMENETSNVSNTRLFCTDPREGVAVVEIAKPSKLGAVGPTDSRTPLCVATVGVDSNERPLIERIECHLQIDHDYVAKVTLRSTGLGDENSVEFHDLEFALALPQAKGIPDPGSASKKRGERPLRRLANSNLAQRANVVRAEDDAADDEMWRTVPGDLVARWRAGHFDKRVNLATPRQIEERAFYNPCGICNRTATQIAREGPISQCRDSCMTAGATHRD